MQRILHHGKRVLRIASGIVVVVVGLVMMIPGVPGPGFLVVFFGLSILAVDFVWAHRLKTHLKDKATQMANKVRGRKPGQGATVAPAAGLSAGLGKPEPPKPTP